MITQQEMILKPKLGLLELAKRWVQRTPQGVPDDALRMFPKQKDIVFSTWLPVERMSSCVYGVPCDLPTERSVNGQISRMRDGEMVGLV